MPRFTTLTLILAAGLSLAAGSAMAQTVNWTTGTLGATQKVADNLLNPLIISFGGNKIWKSNNPEIVKGAGWLMENSRADATRGGVAYPLAGCTTAYMFHINQIGSGAYLHLLASNPNNATVTISAKGSMYNNSQKPLGGKGTGQSFAVSNDWIKNTFLTNFTGRAVNSLTATEVAKVAMANSNMVDGRFEICASAPIYLYSVVTLTGTTNDAIAKSQGGPAAGEIHPSNTNAFGREAGVYATSQVSGTTNVALPAAGKYAAFAFDTTKKLSTTTQEQTAPAVMRLSDSSDITAGNYGHKYDVTLHMTNPDPVAKKVRLSFASSFTAATDKPSFTFNSSATLNGSAVTLWTTPTQPKQVLANWTVPANGVFDARLVTFIAGLGVTNQQLILEVLP